jgi:hypothetical protein
MNVEKVVTGLTSKESDLIRQAGLEVINNSQNQKIIESLIPHLKQIRNSTRGLELGGAFATNNRFYKFPIEIIEFYKSKLSISNRNKKCSCTLYVSKNYESFNPEKESVNKTIRQNVKLIGNYNTNYEIQCEKCNKKYYVSEREYHYTWWKWRSIDQEVELKLSGNPPIDNEYTFLISSIQSVIKNEPRNKTELKYSLERIRNFRMKLGSFKGTEFYESRFEWKIEFENLENKIEVLVVENEA